MTTTKHTGSANSVGQPGFSVKSPCGRVWFVPLEKVREKYAKFLMRADGLSQKEARERAGNADESLPTWFCEEFTWGNVEDYGQLVAHATPADIEHALNSVRDGSDMRPGDVAQAVDVPHA